MQERFFFVYNFRSEDEENNIPLNQSQNSTKDKEVCKLNKNKYLQRNQIWTICTCTCYYYIDAIVECNFVNWT